MHVIPPKKLYHGYKYSRDALDLQNIAQIPKVIFTVVQSHFESHLKR